MPLSLRVSTRSAVIVIISWLALWIVGLLKIRVYRKSAAPRYKQNDE